MASSGALVMGWMSRQTITGRSSTRPHGLDWVPDRSSCKGEGEGDEISSVAPVSSSKRAPPPPARCIELPLSDNCLPGRASYLPLHLFTMGNSAPLTAGAALRLEYRQMVGTMGNLTPDELSHINWSDNSVRTGLILGVTVACVALIFIFVIARLLVRRLMTGQFFLDDSKSAAILEYRSLSRPY